MLTTPGGWEGAAARTWLLWLLLSFVHIPRAATFGIPEFLEFGECPDLRIDPNTNFEMYSGIWFAMEHVPNEYSAITACSMTNYTWHGDIMTVVERGLNAQGQKVRQNSLMRPTEGQPGVLTVDAEGVPSAPYQIVATDYENYACVHSCMSFMGFRAAFSWIFTRVPNPDHAYLALCRDLLAEHSIDPSALKPVDQGDDCPYKNKLDTLLTYTHRVLRKAKAKAQEDSGKKKVVTKEPIPTILEEPQKEATQVPQHVPIQENPQQETTQATQHVPTQENPQPETTQATQHVPIQVQETSQVPQNGPAQVPKHEATEVPQPSSSVRSDDQEALQSFMKKEEEHLLELKREIMEEEEHLRHTLEADRRLQEDEIQELRDEVIHMSRHHRKQHRIEQPSTSVSSSDALRLSTLAALLAAVPYLIS